jgi:hypothetical protein
MRVVVVDVDGRQHRAGDAPGRGDYPAFEEASGILWDQVALLKKTGGVGKGFEHTGGEPSVHKIVSVQILGNEGTVLETAAI